MTSPHENQPPPTKALPEQWREIAVDLARRGPRHAAALAAILEATFTAPWEQELREEAVELARWLRAAGPSVGRGSP
jgi:hypothetical protein